MSRHTDAASRKAPMGRFLPAMTLLLTLAATLALPAASARAAITRFDAFGNMQYNQIANNTQPTAPPLDYFASRLFYTNSGDVTTANGTSGGQPGFSYTPQPGNFALFQTGIITPAALAGYQAPFSLFSANVSAGNLAGQTGSGTFGPTLFSAVPYLTGNSYASLQGLNAAQSDTITFNGFTAVTGANESDIFFTVSRVSDGATVFSSSFLPNTTTSVTIAANTLAAGTAYSIDLDYSSRLNTPNAGFGGAIFTAAYDQRTEIAFTTATAAVVPEPTSLALTALGVASAALTLRARRRK